MKSSVVAQIAGAARFLRSAGLTSTRRVLARYFGALPPADGADPGGFAPFTVDGKLLRGTFANDRAAVVTLVAAYLRRERRVVDQERVEGGDELGAVRRLLLTLPVEGRVLTSDSLQTQRDVGRAVVQKGGVRAPGQGQPARPERRVRARARFAPSPSGRDDRSARRTRRGGHAHASRRRRHRLARRGPGQVARACAQRHRRLEAALTATLDHAAETPKQGPVVEAGVRRLLVEGFPYGVLYAVEAERVVVLAVMHLRRRPGDWRGRRG